MVAPDLSPASLYSAPQDSVASGTLYSTRGAPWLGRAYDPGALTVTAIGTFSIGFYPSGVTAGINFKQDERLLVDKALVRQPF